MRKFTVFLAGFLTGGALVYSSMNFHLIRSKQGFHAIPKVRAQFSSTFADIRDYDLSDWAANAEIAAALVQANRRDLMDDAIQEKINQSIDGFFGNAPR